MRRVRRVCCAQVHENEKWMVEKKKRRKERKKEEEEEKEEKEKREEKKAVRPRADRFIDLSSGLLSPSFFTFLSTLGFSFSLLTLFC